MEMPNKALQEQFSYDGSDLPEGVLEQLKSASRMYYRFDTDMEAKKKAINILADILEKVRDDLKETLNQEYDVSKNDRKLQVQVGHPLVERGLKVSHDFG